MNRKLQSGITLITPTGDRPIALERAIFYVKRFTEHYSKDNLQWIVVDDSVDDRIDITKFPSYVDYFALVYPGSKAKSFSNNLLTAVRNVKYDKILVIEDDDWYHEDYLDVSLHRLSNCEITGESKALYYNVALRCYRYNNNTDRASLCQTVFRGNLLPKLEKYIKVNPDSAFVDARLWKHCRENNVPFKLFQDRRVCVGMKGLPGRKGIGIGHRPKTYMDDGYWRVLKKSIGKDAQWYIDLMKKEKNK